jgi:hypothetical protein
MPERSAIASSRFAAAPEALKAAFKKTGPMGNGSTTRCS